MYAEDADFREKWFKIKKYNKEQFAEYVKKSMDIDVNINSIFDCQIKRIHEYKRQLLNVLNIINMYLEIKDHPHAHPVPRTFILSGKAAPSYFMAKLIIKLANSVADIVNHDKEVGDKKKAIESSANKNLVKSKGLLKPIFCIHSLYALNISRLSKIYVN